MSVVTSNALAGWDHPGAFGPYSPAVRVGQLVFVSAQPGVEPTTNQLPRSLETECRQAFHNLARALQTADASMRDVAKTTVFYVDPQHLPIINAVYAEVFPVDPPARTAAIVKLAAGRRIVVDAIAVTPRDERHC